MKKTIVSLGVIVFALIFVLLSCDSKKPEGATSSLASIPVKDKTVPAPDAPRVEGPDFISGSELAFKSYLSDPRAKIDHVKAMYSSSQAERRIVAGYTDQASTSYSHKLASLLAEEICLCPGTSNGVCPCVGDTTSLNIAVSDASVKVFYGSQELKEKKNKGKVEGKFKAFQWPANLAEGPDTLTLIGKFGGRTAMKYRVPVEYTGGKLYFKWRK
jgi:hypothetical protein